MGLSYGAEWDSSDEQDFESPQVRPRIAIPGADILHERRALEYEWSMSPRGISRCQDNERQISFGKMNPNTEYFQIGGQQAGTVWCL